ncbi:MULTISPECIES: HD domain-containing protein [Paenibacillus]|uniref:HD domain-containing protein n=1 Tax=Paenibacillus residui TaxID=629724 RepID=A0ABW3DAI7_9BACL|nr:HD domain-containing protein [Paenibacillus sp. 32O-W]
MVLVNEQDYIARTDAASDTLWEPLWRIATPLLPVEKRILQSSALRRLHYVHHGGASRINTHHTFSRLQHTLGVFSLIAHYCPDNGTLRAASLLHDIGHGPFSHSLEGIEGIDHHQWTRDMLFGEELSGILQEHGIHPEEIWAYVHGEVPSLLRNSTGVLHLDHLDSWARSAQAGGYLPVEPNELLDRLFPAPDGVQADREAAELMVDLIVEEAKFHTSPANIAANSELRQIVFQWIREARPDKRQLIGMTDSMLEQELLRHPGTSGRLRRLLLESWRLRVTRDRDQAPADALEVEVNKLYLSVPMVQGRKITEISERARGRIEDVQHRKGKYYVYWQD